MALRETAYLLAVHQGAVEIEHDELERPVHGAGFKGARGPRQAGIAKAPGGCQDLRCRGAKLGGIRGNAIPGRVHRHQT